jgi:putative transposase
LAAKPEDWEWSSARAHLAGKDDGLVEAGPLLSRVPYAWGRFLESPAAPVEADLLRRHERTGRPLGSVEFVKKLERRLDRSLLPQKPGPKPGPK